MKRIIHFFSRLCEAYLPDAFVFCLLLTLVVFMAAWNLTPHHATALAGFWGREFWSLNAFSMQMIFVLLSGHMLASTPLVKSIIELLVRPIKKESHALILLSSLSIFTCWLNWGLGLMVSAILSVELGKKIRKSHFPLFVATAYAGFVVWHGGLSGSVPLKIAGKDEILTKIYPGLSIGLDSTIFSPYNILIIALIFLIFPLCALGLRTEKKEELRFDSSKNIISGNQSFRWFSMENGPLLTIIFSSIFLAVLYQTFKEGSPFDINRMNFLFLTLAFILHGTPKGFLDALNHSFSSASGIAIQFPFYAGLMGLMQYSGLVELLSNLVIQISTAQTLPLWTFLSAGVVNMFIPSGGGQWVVQGPVILTAAREIGADPGKVSMALAWGDAWTNLIQPFWALPILGLAGLKLKDIMGYCLVYLIASGLIISGVFLWT
jgi:short-chain fatty acids transporter